MNKKNQDDFNPRDEWTAPEHGRSARHMNRDYRRDDYQRPLREYGRELQVDARPAQLVPERKPYRDRL